MTLINSIPFLLHSVSFIPTVHQGFTNQCSVSILEIYNQFLCKTASNPTTRIGNSSSSVTKMRYKIEKGLRAVYLLLYFSKKCQLDLFKASDSISDHLTSIFTENFRSSDFFCGGQKLSKMVNNCQRLFKMVKNGKKK